MSAAQSAIQAQESCVLRQGKYQIHPISDDNEAKDLERIGIKAIEVWTVEKFDGEYVGQDPVEVKVFFEEIS